MGIWDSYLGLRRDMSQADRGGLTEEERVKQQRIAQGLIGGNVQVTGEMRSTENFDAQGAPIFDKAVQQAPRAGDGFLGSARTGDDKAKLYKGLLGAGYEPAKAASISDTVGKTAGTTVDASGLLGNPYDPKSIMNYRNQALASGMPNEAINQQVKAAQRVGSFENQNQQLSAYRSQKSDYEKNIAKPRAVLETFQGATDVISGKGGFEAMTPADDLALISAFAQMQRPGEAMNEGDVTNIMKTSGMWDQVKAAFKSGGATALGKDVRKKIYSTMSSMANTQEKRYTDIRSQTQKTYEQSGFAGLSSPMRPAMNVQPFKSRPMSEEEFKAARSRGEI